MEKGIWLQMADKHTESHDVVLSLARKWEFTHESKVGNNGLSPKKNKENGIKCIEYLNSIIH